ncbi:type II CRISPR RNA-guided endonuclease Cas9 [Spiroplasma eriocheiris]|uniref:CRISPR-associated endonuclease Cas9 n=1 Tax=Spiroplasma eriocheiris TaxID=315358 RepID=A0A0H3XIZ0_9MOLU|nr:type II CRISPR RNA-guided endonuclease Cas9 [Spiroplasma eriocheiris]AHF57268.1 hypothetical protein SPE_0134 [Spiroplasma eriocheiris CCTCC M 207170]AKM53731.1 CRISPR-associated protein Cas9 [Spiroplasma eriocheiris]
MEHKKLILGLDLGISSCGWAITAQTQEGKWILEDFGVRLFQVPENSKDGTTNAEARRLKRSARRLIRRRKNRKEDLIKLFERINFLNKEDLKNYINSHSATNLVDDFNRNELYNPYYLRYIGLNNQLTKEELVWSLIHIANRRGYSNKFSFGDKLPKGLEEAIKSATLNEKYRTLSEEIIKNEKYRDPNNSKAILVRNKGGKEGKENFQYLFSRTDYINEVQKLLENQSKYYPILTEANIKNIIDIIFRQRDFEDGPGPKNEKLRKLYKEKNKQFSKNFTQLEGRCSFYRNEKVGFKSSILFDIFHVVSEISKISKYIEGDHVLAKKIIDNFLYNDQNKKGKTLLKEILKQHIDENIFDSPAYKNIEFKTNYLNLLKEVFGYYVLKDVDINNLNKNIYYELGEIIHTNITPKRKEEKIVEWLSKNNLVLSEEKLHILLKPNSSLSTTAKTSFKWMQEAVDKFLSGVPYGKFQADFNKNNEFKLTDAFEKRYKKYLTGEKEFEMFAAIIDPDLWRNPIVFRAINQTRKVIKALFEKYGYINQINIELTREMGMAFKDRKKLLDEQFRNYKEREDARKALLANGVLVNDTNILKYRLWEQQLHKSMYSGENINLSDLGNDKILQIDHIIPYSKLPDDSLNNKVLVFAKENQDKGNRIANDYVKTLGSEIYKNYRNRINYLSSQNKISSKKADYLLCETENEEYLNDFLSRNLNDTRYITRYVMNWLKSEFEIQKRLGLAIPNVLAMNGAVTSRFRRIWLRNSPWGLDQKVREITPWHHAVDAIIISNFNNFSEVQFANDIVTLMNYRKKLNDKEWDELLQELLRKWQNNSKIFIPNVEKRLLEIKNNNPKQIHYSLIDNLQDIIDQRMPLVLKTEKIKKEIKDKNNKEYIFDNFPIPKFVKVKDPDEYIIENKHLEGNIRYPFVSYKIEKKMNGKITDENPIKNKNTKKINDVYIDNKFNDKKYLLDSKGNIWNNSSYVFLCIWKDEKCRKGYNYQFIKYYEYLNSTNKYENKIKLRKWSLVRFLLNGKFCYEYYQAKKTDDKIYRNMLNTVYKSTKDDKESKNIFGVQNYYGSISKWFNNLELVQVDILGNTKIVKVS